MKHLKSLFTVIGILLSTGMGYASTGTQLPNLQADNVVFESATESVKNMGLGWNLGNALEANLQTVTDITSPSYWGQQDLNSETCWGQFATKPKLLNMMKDAGFGAIRVPVTWFNHTDINGNIDKNWMKRVHEVVDYVIDAGMYCIINVHHDTGADSDKWKSWIKADTKNYTANKDRYEMIWKQIAEEFKDYGQKLLFESYNEMLDGLNSWNYASFNASGRYDAASALSSYTAINNYADSFVKTVRSSGGYNNQRNLIVNTYGACAGYDSWSTHLPEPLIEMKKPEGETDHLIFEVHSYPNIENMAKTKSCVDEMINKLNNNLVSKGAPVIIGEWGTSNVDKGEGKTDYDVRRADMFEFVDYFIKKTKENNISTFYWMGLSNGMSRLYPAFDQADLALKMLQAWHGSSYNPTLPSLEDFKDASISATINYTKQWGEFSIFTGSVNSNDYKGIQIELDKDPGAGKVQFKIYDSGKTQDFNLANYTLDFTSAMGTITNITLQWKLATNGSIRIKGVWLIKKDGTKVASNCSVSWGCTMTDVDIKTGITQMTYNKVKNDAIYNLSGQRVTNPARGIYIRSGKKYVVR